MLVEEMVIEGLLPVGDVGALVAGLPVPDVHVLLLTALIRHNNTSRKGV